MKSLVSLVLLALGSWASAQSPQQYISSLYDAKAGAFKVVPDGKPGLRATSGAVRGLQYLGETKIANKEKLIAFVKSCYRPETGAFAEPGGQPDVTITSVGVLAAVSLDIDAKSIAKCMEYLKQNAKSFEDVRIAAAAAEVWNEAYLTQQFDAKTWYPIAESFRTSDEFKNGGPRSLGSYAAFRLRLGQTVDDPNAITKQLIDGQRADGGWGKTGEPSDSETTYRIMRALKHLKAKPNVESLTKYLASCRNADGGSGTKPGEKSSMSGTYYSAAIAMWMKP